MSEISRLSWKCRRGTKELDLLLQGYLENVYPHAPSKEQAVFRELLELQDPELSDLILHDRAPEDAAFIELVQRLRQYR